MQGKPKFAIKHHRRKENLSLYLIEKPRTPAERQQNKETLELAVKIRAEREQEFKESMLVSPEKRPEREFLGLFSSLYQ